MRRTIQTSLLSLQWLIKSGVPVEVDAMWQENSTKPCDTGSDLSHLASAFPELDFSAVDPAFTDKAQNSPYAFTASANKARGQACIEKLYARKEQVIAVVSHGGFLRTGISKRRFANADYRIFTFEKDAQGDLELVEDEETERNGGGLGRSEFGVHLVRDWDFPPENVEEIEEE